MIRGCRRFTSETSISDEWLYLLRIYATRPWYYAVSWRNALHTFTVQMDTHGINSKANNIRVVSWAFLFLTLEITPPYRTKRITLFYGCQLKRTQKLTKPYHICKTWYSHHGNGSKSSCQTTDEEKMSALLSKVETEAVIVHWVPRSKMASTHTHNGDGVEQTPFRIKCWHIQKYTRATRVLWRWGKAVSKRAADVPKEEGE